MNELQLRSGTMRDYHALSRYHYLANAPVTATRVWVMEDAARSIEQRWHAMRGMRGAPDKPRVVAVLVESLPALSCAMRDAALPGRYTGMDRRSAARLLNGVIRCISRVVVHPQYRGLGLAVRLVRHALATAETSYTEALAAMGRVHPFFKLAGMIEYERPPHAKDQRLLDTMRSAGVAAWELASRSRMQHRLTGNATKGETQGNPHPEGRAATGIYDRRLSIIKSPCRAVDSEPDADNPLGEADAALLRSALQRWAGRGLSFDEQLDRARRKLLTEPRYYLHAT